MNTYNLQRFGFRSPQARAAIEAFREKLIHANMAIINSIDPDSLSEAIKKQLDRAKIGDMEALKFIIALIDTSTNRVAAVNSIAPTHNTPTMLNGHVADNDDDDDEGE
jgi:hypothetical protein